MTGPRLLRARRPGEIPSLLPRVVRHLRRGGLLAYPTETVYGLGCVLAPGPLGRLASLKGREPGKPFLLLVGDPTMAPGLRWTDEARALARAFWPGPLTLVLEDRRGSFPPEVREAGGGVGVRVSPHPFAGALVEALGAPLTSTSANRPGEPPARTGEEAYRVVRLLGGGEDVWVVDGGRLPPSPPSTVVDCTGRPPRVLRVGAVPVGALRDVVPGIGGAGDA